MADPFVAEIRIFPFNFAPTGWALCDGQLLPISQNTALFSLMGTTYGGDGKSNFALPNLQGSTTIHQGQGPGLTLRDLGEVGGEQAVTLNQSHVLTHTHVASASTNAANTGNPQDALPAATDPSNPIYVGSPGGTLTMGPGSVGTSASSSPHNNL